eukprot:301469-Amphidinium_carterae.1
MATRPRRTKCYAFHSIGALSVRSDDSIEVLMRALAHDLLDQHFRVLAEPDRLGSTRMLHAVLCAHDPSF